MRRLTILFFIIPALGIAATPKFDTILYGVSYYHEYMPYERLEQDVALMEKAGITVVRLGESTWTSFEPQEGKFEFAWMERILDRLHKAGIKVIFGTPTYSIPPWLYAKHPEIVVAQLGARQPLGPDRYENAYFDSLSWGAYGPRQNMDITHPVYRWYSERIVRQVVSRFAKHPAIIGFQVDNETHPNSSNSRSMHNSFVGYLKSRFGSVEKLNRLWGLAYWGQLVSGWDDFPMRQGVLNPGYKLEWERYQRQTVTDFLGWQAKIVREYSLPEHFVTHNWPGGIRTDADQQSVARFLDIVSVNPYHTVQDRLDGQHISFCGDLTRSQKQSNYLVTETNAQTTGWDSRTQFPPWDGQLRLNAYSHVASGANMVAYWHWHSLHYGQETYWKGLLAHDLEPNRIYHEAARIALEFKKIGPRIVNFRQKNNVAILASVDSYHGIQFMPFDDRVNYMTILNQMYGALYRQNIGTDFLFPESADLANYKVILVPALYIASDELLGRLAKFVEDGGHLVMTMKSAFANEYSTVRWEKAPGPMRKAAGFYYQEFSTLAQPLALKGDPFQAGDANRVSTWAEMLIPETAQVLAVYDHPFFSKYPALTRNKFGKGTFTYEGTVLSDKLQEKVLLGVCELAGLSRPDQKLPASVRVKNGTGNAGNAMHFYLNYSGSEQTFMYPHNGGVEILTSKVVGRFSNVTLPPWDLAIIEEK